LRCASCVSFVLFVSFVFLAPAVLAQTGGPEEPLVHVVQRGETLFSIARRYAVSVEAITYANSISDPRNIYVGQQLLIPGAALVDAWATHIVLPGETLPAIAGRYGLAWRTVALANHLIDPHLLVAGQVLRIPTERGSETSGALHTVLPGETLTQIAFHYGVSRWELMEANPGPVTVYSGRWLLIPGLHPSWMPAPFVEVSLDPLPARQGEPLLVTVQTDEPVTLEGVLDDFCHLDHPIMFAEEGGLYYAMVGFDALTDPGVYELVLIATDETGHQVALSVEIVVEEGEYTYERIEISPGLSGLLDPDLIVAERERLESVRRLFTPLRRWDGPFLRPVEAAVSSEFGTRRSYGDGPYNSYHTGVDFSAGMGTYVHAPADGTVVLAEPLTVRGNVVVLDHGWGVLTGYWHLSEIGVTVGQEVRAGEVIGRVGSTGLSTGAHLHWEVWVGGVSVNGLQLLAPAYPWPGLE